MKFLLNKVKNKNIFHFKFYRFGVYFLFSKRFLFIFLSFIFLLFTASCTGKYDLAEEKEIINELHLGNFSKILNTDKNVLKKLNSTGDASLYCVGLYLKKDRNNIARAKQVFDYASKHSVYPYNRLSRDEFYLLCSNYEKLKIINDIIADKENSFQESDKEHKKKQRLFLLLKRFDKLELPLHEYLASIKFDKEIINFLDVFFNNNNDFFGVKKYSVPKSFVKITKGRILLAKYRYQEAWDIFSPFIENCDLYPYLQNRNILSDIGKAALFGSKEYKKNALIFENCLKALEDKIFNETYNKTEKYMYAFYAARLNLKIQDRDGTNKALKLFKHSLNYAPSDNDFDNALWYYLDILRNKDFNLFFDEFCKSILSWKNCNEYEDLVAYTCRVILAKRDKKKFLEFKNVIDQTDLVEAQARNSYILARIYEFSERATEQQESKILYDDVCKKNQYFLYYRLLANYRLNVKKTDYLSRRLLKYSSYGKNNSLLENHFSDEICLNILNNLTKYKLYDELYRHVRSIYPAILVNDAEKFARILEKNKYYSDSIRLMTYALRINNAIPDKKQLKLVYPRPYLGIVKKYAKEFNVPEYLIFGLIRSESYFMQKVVSHAGAIGLAQLMKPTAKEISRRFKIENYDLTNPDTNIMFGSYYISKMISDKDGDIMSALFSYNAGATAVRRWQRKFKDFPSDLFLEILPYSETRGYGRHVFTASAMYAELYYSKSYSDIIKEFFQFENTSKSN